MILQASKRQLKKKYPKEKPSKFPLLQIALGIFLFVNIVFTGLIVTKFNIIEVFFALTSKGSFNGVNILAYGVDDTHSSKRADSIMLFHLDDSLSHLGVLSIPRDTRVPIDGYDKSRVNHSYSYGGRDLLTKTISNFLNVPIHHHIEINLSGVSEIIDEMGGVMIDVEKDMKYIDQAGDLYIDIEKGKQKLSGNEVIQYLRFRQDQEGDIGRIRRQQHFVYTLANQFVKPDRVFDLHKLIKGIGSVLDTDLSTKEMVKLSTLFKKAYKKGAIKKETLPGKIMLIGNAYYWEPNEEKLEESIAKIFEKPTSLDKLIALNEQVEFVEKPRKNGTELQSQIDLEPKQGFSTNVLQTKIYAEEKMLSSEPEKNIQTKKQTNVKKLEQLSNTMDNDYENNSLENQLKFENLKKEELFFDDTIDVTKIEKKETPKKASLWSFFNNEKDVDKNEKTEAALEVTLFEDEIEPKVSVDENIKLDQIIKKEVTEKINTKLIEKYTQNSQQSEIKKSLKQIDDVLILSTLNGIIEVLNGYGTPKEAQVAARLLKKTGISVSRFADAGNYNYKKTVLVDWKGNTEGVNNVSEFLEIDPSNIIVYDKPNKTIDYTLVLGQDWPNIKELILNRL